MKTFGDSIVAGVGASTNLLSWVGRFTPVNNGLSSSQAADCSRIVQAETPSESEVYTVCIGANDAAKYGNDSAKKEFFRNCFRACIAWLLLVDKKTGWGPQAGITFTGTWTQSPSPCPCGKYTTQAGASASATVSGTGVWVGLSECDHTDMSESVSVTIDGIDKGTFSVKRPGVTTILGQWWGRCAWYFGGLSSGGHTVTITQNSNGKYLHLDYISGSSQSATPKILVGNAMKFTDSYYASLGINSATTQAYNAIISDVVSEFTANGLPITQVDNYSVFDPSTMSSDQYGHPNDAGYLAIYNNMSNAM